MERYSYFQFGDISKYALAAVKDVPIEYEYRIQVSQPYNSGYFNSDVMLLNLEYWRKNDAEVQLLQYMAENIYYDQDTLNAVFRDQWFALHPRWNKYHIYPCLYPPRFSNWKDEYLFK
jgi:lipopolysaccharide biosynthesis glycosyltransferase